MNRRAAFLLLCGLLLAPLASPAAARARDPLVPRAFFFTAAQSAQNPAPAAETQPPRPNVTAYALPPALYEKAHHLGQIELWFALLGFAYGVVLLWLILKWRLAPKYRDWAEKASRNRFVQAAILAPLLILTIDALSLPLDIHQQWVDRRYGLSIQSWPSWMWDWTKSELLTVIGGAIVVYILYAVIRKSPRRWWFYFWLVSLPLGLLVVFAQPLVVDPMFHKFEPLAQKDPALTASLERLARHIGENIPPERMFWMGASEKSTELNAYVTGFGASKRIVLWDTTVAKMNTPQIVFVAGHEMGHYVLRHIPKGIALGALFSLLLFYLAFRSIDWMMSRWGPAWHIRGVDDLASLPALLLLLAIFSFVSDPIANAVSRHFEHQADQYGLEATHSLTPDSGEVAAQSFQVLGEVDLSDPAPNPVDVFLFYTHPPVADRIRFALTYDPWASGGHGAFVEH